MLPTSRNIVHEAREETAMTASDPGCAKTKTDFFLSVTTSLKILSAVIPRGIFTQPGPEADPLDRQLVHCKSNCSRPAGVGGVMEFAERKAMEFPRANLLGLDVGRPDHLAPLVGFVGDELAEIRG
jgi:hypothetical protein